MNLRLLNTSSICIDAFNKLNWLPFYVESSIRRCMVAYNRTKGDVPEYLKQLLVLNSDMHSRSTRNARLTFLTPRYNRQTEGGGSFAVRTNKCWNSLPFEIRSSTSVNCLKHLLYQFFLDYQEEHELFGSFSSMFGM